MAGRARAGRGGGRGRVGKEMQVLLVMPNMAVVQISIFQAKTRKKGGQNHKLTSRNRETPSGSSSSPSFSTSSLSMLACLSAAVAAVETGVSVRTSSASGARAPRSEASCASRASSVIRNAMEGVAVSKHIDLASLYNVTEAVLDLNETRWMSFKLHLQHYQCHRRTSSNVIQAETKKKNTH